jgi:hypothetical protein
MQRDIRLTVTYFLGATLLTVLIVFQGQRSDDQVTTSIRSLEKRLEVHVENLSFEFCETINDMHRIRGFEVIDCDTGTVSMDTVKAQDDTE